MKNIKNPISLFLVSGFLALPGFASLTGPAAVVLPGPSTPNVSGQTAQALPKAPALTPAEWQELRDAHQKALAANPDLLTKKSELNERMRAFQAKLNAAMIKENPKVEAVIAKLRGPHLAATTTAAPSSSQHP